MRTNRLSPKWCSVAIFCAFLGAPAVAQDADWQKDLAAWRTQHVADLLKPDGWLSLSGLEWLEAGDNSFGSAKDNKIHIRAGSPTHIGILRFDGKTVKLIPPAEGFPTDFRVADAPAKEQVIPVDVDNDKNALHMTTGTLNMYVIRRGDRFALRVKDAQSQAIVAFHGLNWYDPDIHFRVKAKWTPYNPQRSITLVTLARTEYARPVPGAAEFTLDGKSYRLQPVVEDPEKAQLFFILRDTTSATATYPACRFLYTVLPSQGLDKAGELWLDFNRLENPPCAYTPFATCPLPPPQNKLAIPLPVGEKRYDE